MKRKTLAIELGYDLTWQEIKSEKVHPAIQTILDDNNAKYGVHHEESGLFGCTDEKELVNAYSAAVVALNAITEADKEINAIIEKMPNGRYWIVGINTDDCQLINGYDKLVSEKDLINDVHDLISILTEAEYDFRLLADEETAELIEREIGESASEIGTIEDLISGFVETNKKALLKDAKIKKHKGVSSILVILLGVAALAAGAIFTISTSDEGALNESLLGDVVEKVPMVQRQKSAQEIEKELLEAAYSEEIKWLTDDFKKQDTVKLVNSIVKVHQRVPLYIAGWRIEKLTYSSDRPKEITAIATRTVFGTPITLREGIKNYERISLEGSDRAKISYKIPDIKREESIKDVIGYIKSGKYKTIEIAHDSHYLGLGFEVAEYDTSDRKEPVKGIRDEEKANRSQLKTVANILELQGKGIDHLQSSQLMLDKAKTTIIKEVTLSRHKGANWSLKGIVYER